MEQIVVKTEVQANGEILLFYVDDNEGTEEGVLKAIESLDQEQIEQLQASQVDTEAVLEGEVLDEDVWTTEEFNEERQHAPSSRPWLYDEINKLLTFYIDNKGAFKSGVAKKKDLWNVACKTMLLGRNIAQCEMKLRNIKRKYSEMRRDQIKGVFTSHWPHYDLCHQAFQDDDFVSLFLGKSITKKVINVPVQEKTNGDNVIMVKKVGTRNTDEKVETMLNLYIKYKDNQKSYWQKGLWEMIALHLGEDGEYWHKRFLNFKQHYVRLLEKRAQNGPDSVSWPYMKLFDQIFESDQEFQRKCRPKDQHIVVPNDTVLEWNHTETTILVKYCFECFNEFQDPTIPTKFLWSEIGRLLDIPPDVCQKQYELLKQEHLDKYLEEEIDMRSRSVLQILFDNIISKEVQLEFNKKAFVEEELWKTSEIDELVQHFYNNIEMFKDSIGYYVCWFVIAKKLKRSLHSCRKQWNELTFLYKSILDDKKENPDMQIDWRYIELFDRIFDYGMDTNMLVGYENLNTKSNQTSSNHVKDNLQDDEDMITEEESDEDFDGRPKRKTGDSKAFKILDFYLKNKDKFASRKKLPLWDVLGKQIGLTATQCAHRFRNLKQVYKGYVQREINKPAMPIVWPYYPLCKKVFGYRALKAKLRNNVDSEEEDWSAKEIKLLINYFARNYDTINNTDVDNSKWSPLAQDVGRNETACAEKFFEIRRSYRKLKAMKSRNPEVKLTWKYYNMIDAIYNSNPVADIENSVDGNVEIERLEEYQEDDEYQCIIVLPEDQEMTEIDASQIIIEEQPTEEQTTEAVVRKIRKWTRVSKKKLLLNYLKYIKTYKGQTINRKQMWSDISSKLNKSVLSCRKMFVKLKKEHLANIDKDEYKATPFYSLFERILKMKPKFDKTQQNNDLEQTKIYHDVDVEDAKLEKALNYYLQHIDEFTSPKYDKQYIWVELANYADVPVNDIFNKVNYLIHTYNDNSPYAGIIKEILFKENSVTVVEDHIVTEDDQSWSDDEIEQLLIWYLGHLDKFKNPKFVRKYLWLDAAAILNKTPLSCSKKMAEVRTQYRTMVKEESVELNNWRFLDLCQKIYGTGKKNVHSDNQCLNYVLQ